jgi:hypothetical protein
MFGVDGVNEILRGVKVVGGVNEGQISHDQLLPFESVTSMMFTYD